MGIDTNGGMIIGNEYKLINVDKFELPKDYDYDVWEFLMSDLDPWMNNMSPWYDSDRENCIVGYLIKDVLVSDMSGEWLKDVKEKSELFEKITGVKAKLIGMQDVT
jgi:hypothetical protein